MPVSSNLFRQLSSINKNPRSSLISDCFCFSHMRQNAFKRPPRHCSNISGILSPKLMTRWLSHLRKHRLPMDFEPERGWYGTVSPSAYKSIHASTRHHAAQHKSAWVRSHAIFNAGAAMLVFGLQKFIVIHGG